MSITEGLLLVRRFLLKIHISVKVVHTGLTYMPNMDREILLISLKSAEFGFDAPEIEQVKPASDGRIPEWCEEFGEKEPEHRHVSHLYCVYPSPFECSDELKKACEKSLYARGFGGTGWSLGWKVCLWARLGNAENANTLIKNQLRPKHPKVNIFIRAAARIRISLMRILLSR